MATERTLVKVSTTTRPHERHLLSVQSCPAWPHRGLHTHLLQDIRAQVCSRCEHRRNFGITVCANKLVTTSTNTKAVISAKNDASRLRRASIVDPTHKKKRRNETKSSLHPILLFLSRRRHLCKVQPRRFLSPSVDALVVLPIAVGCVFTDGLARLRRHGHEHRCNSQAESDEKSMPASRSHARCARRRSVVPQPLGESDGRVR